MGKKRITIVGEEKKKVEKKVKPKVDVEEAQEPKKEAKPKKVVKKQKKTKKENTRGQRYQEARQKVDRAQLYSLTEALKLVKEVSISDFVGSVDVHLVVTEIGLSGEIVFPHSTGKTQAIKIADEALLAQLEKGKIDFTALIAHPSMMPKLAKFAKLLGPRGLMPNPKAGTISENPEKLVKELTGKNRFKTETKFPLIHMTIGKTDNKEEELKENFVALIEAVGKKKILKAVIAPTMGPGIKIDLAKLA